MRILTVIAILFVVSCGHHEQEKAPLVILPDTSLKFTAKYNEPAKFECGTAELLSKQFNSFEETIPANYKKISMVTTKQQFKRMLYRAAADSLVISGFDMKQFNDLYLPRPEDKYWFTMDFNQLCSILQPEKDSVPLYITYKVADIGKINVSLSTEPALAERLEKIWEQAGNR